ncbi:MAG: hypothetical protein ACK55I_01125, partial [bacterium]
MREQDQGLRTGSDLDNRDAGSSGGCGTVQNENGGDQSGARLRGAIRIPADDCDHFDRDHHGSAGELYRAMITKLVIAFGSMRAVARALGTTHSSIARRLTDSKTLRREHLLAAEAL